MKTSIAIIGIGNLGSALLKGIVSSGEFKEAAIYATKRQSVTEQKKGYILTNNIEAVKKAQVVILAVQPGQLHGLAEEIKDYITEKHTIVSTLTGVSIDKLKSFFGQNLAIIRAMPNTATAVNESMTCIASNGNAKPSKAIAEKIFSTVGATLEIDESLMQAATVLGASGVAFWLRIIRAAMQGGIQMGFDAPESLAIVAQVCKGASSLLQQAHKHPEAEIDRVTTPKGCTITGLNEMEHAGLSSALIKGLLASYDKINEIRDEVV